MPKRDGTNQEEDSPKQARLCWFARHSWLATSGANLYRPGVWLAVVMLSFSSVTFVLFNFVFVFFASIEAAALRSIVPRYICAPTATRCSLTTICVLLFVCLFVIVLEMSLFPSTFCTIAVKCLYGEYVVCFPFQLVIFHLVSTGWIVDISLREKSTRQSIFINHQQRYGVFSR